MENYYGWIAPIDDKVEYAFNKYAPEGVSFDSTRLWFPGPTPKGLVFLSDQLEEAAKMYRKSPHDVILFGCTSGSCIKGYGFDKECIERIERASGCPGLTTSTAVLEAFEALGLKKTVVMTPYPEDTNQAEKKFLEDNGIEVTSITGIGFNKVGEFGHPSKRHLYRNAMKHGPCHDGAHPGARGRSRHAGHHQPSGQPLGVPAPLRRKRQASQSRETLYHLKIAMRRLKTARRKYNGIQLSRNYHR